ncbi:MAG: hypothetical protein LRY73_03725 [Bacillus sp. (in: Bacteria)]|nr:hypothetical protein [Bacillus sp. (in: firmicutes)]
MLMEKYNSLKNKTKKRPQDIVLQEKLHDIHLVFQRLEMEMADHYIGSEDFLKLLAEKISQSAYLKNADIYIDGFYSFTPLELSVLEQLFMNCTNVKLALTLDRPYGAEERLNELDLFFETAKTYQELSDVCSRTKVKVEEAVVLKDLSIPVSALTPFRG